MKTTQRRHLPDEDAGSFSVWQVGRKYEVHIGDRVLIMGIETLAKARDARDQWRRRYAAWN